MSRRNFKRKSISKMVRNAVDAAVETKFFHKSASVALDNVSTLIQLDQIGSGANEGSRVGNEVTGKRLKLKIFIEPILSAPEYAYIRIMLLRGYVPLVAADIPTNFYSDIDRDKAFVMYDKVHATWPFAGVGNGSGPLVGSGKAISINISKSLRNIKTRWHGTNATDTNRNNYYLILQGRNTTGSATLFYNYTQFYKDA